MLSQVFKILLLFAVGLLGQVIHVFVTIEKTKKSFAALNKSFVLKKFFEDEFTSIVISVACILLVAIGWDEVTAEYPQAQKLSVLIFGAIGFSGSSLVISILNVTGRKILCLTKNNTEEAEKNKPE